MILKRFRAGSSLCSLLVSAVFIIRRVFTDQVGNTLGPSPAGYSSNFFSAQARSILQGHLWVSPSDIPGECFLHNDQCFGYFGIAPSILRIPLIAQVRIDSIQTIFGFTNFMISIALIVGIAASIWLVDYYLNKNFIANGYSNLGFADKVLYVVAIFMAGPGNLLLQITRPAVYEEAIAWSVAFLLLTFVFVSKFLDSLDYRNLYISTVFMVFAVNSRPTVFFISVMLPIIILLLVFSSHSELDKAKAFKALLTMFFAPISTALLVFYLKFRTMFPSLSLNEQVPEAPHWGAIYSVNGSRDLSLRFIPTNFMIYFDPSFSTQFSRMQALSSFFRGDFVSPSERPIKWIWPISEGHLYAERTIGIFVLSPILLFMILILVFSLVKYGPSFENINLRLSLMMLSSLIGCFVLLASVGSANRYTADFVPWIILLSIMSVNSICRIVRDNKRIGMALSLLVLPLAFISVASNLAGLAI